MNLYEVIRWGNDESCDGPNGEDTCFLVRADTVEAAATLVDLILQRMSHQQVQPYAQAVYLLGTDAGIEQTEVVLRGPYTQTAYCCGWRKWYRDEMNAAWFDPEA